MNIGINPCIMVKMDQCLNEVICVLKSDIKDFFTAGKVEHFSKKRFFEDNFSDDIDKLLVSLHYNESEALRCERVCLKAALLEEVGKLNSMNIN